MSEARALINLVGNTVATLVIAKWEGEFDSERGTPLGATKQALSGGRVRKVEG